MNRHILSGFVLFGMTLALLGLMKEQGRSALPGFSESMVEVFPDSSRAVPVLNQGDFEGNWKVFQKDLKKKWEKFTNEDLQEIDGKREKLQGKIEERYADRKEDVKQWVEDWFKKKKIVDDLGLKIDPSFSIQ